MRITVQRYDATPERTIGRLSIEQEFVCFTLEDGLRVGPKVAGATAIPAGRYEVQVTWSSRFQTPLPILMDVPHFTGIRIHAGNTAQDTSGCLLVGMTRGLDTIHDSRAALALVQGEITHALASGEECWITIRNPIPEGTLVA